MTNVYCKHGLETIAQFLNKSIHQVDRCSIHGCRSLVLPKQRSRVLQPSPPSPRPTRRIIRGCPYVVQVHVVAELAKEYGFDDVGGKRPPSIRSLRFLLPTYLFPRVLPKGVNVAATSIPDWLIPMEIMRNGRPPS